MILLQSSASTNNLFLLYLLTSFFALIIWVLILKWVIKSSIIESFKAMEKEKLKAMEKEKLKEKDL
jgi:putative exporter of polyketide antibiotics